MKARRIIVTKKADIANLVKTKTALADKGRSADKGNQEQAQTTIFEAPIRQISSSGRAVGANVIFQGLSRFLRHKKWDCLFCRTLSPFFMASLCGHFLVASQHLMDPNFVRSVVLLVQHNEEGALGVVVKPSHRQECSGIVARGWRWAVP